MVNIDGEISRLSNKDVKIRRRAVRLLFEENNPRALTGFVKLLEDSDFWFRNKSLDAHRKWANTADDLLPLLGNHKRLVAELLQRIDAPEIALSLLEKEDHITALEKTNATQKSRQNPDRMRHQIGRQNQTRRPRHNPRGNKKSNQKSRQHSDRMQRPTGKQHQKRRPYHNSRGNKINQEK